MRYLSFVFLTLLICGPVHGLDEIETLIGKEKTEQVQWEDQDDTEDNVPASFLLGNQTSVTLYSPAIYKKTESFICNGNEFASLVELVDVPAEEETKKINIKIPRVREILGQMCLVRPKDIFVAIGPGKNEAVTLTSFSLHREPSVCASDPVYSLQGQFDEILSSAPFFYSTDLLLKEGKNGFAPAETLATITLSPEMTDQVSSLVPVFSEFQVVASSVSASNVDTLIVLKKRDIHPEDVGLPNEILLGAKGSTLTEIISEPVEKHRKSGHVHLIGILDFNQDGLLDLLVGGDRDGCPYRLLFEGIPAGFRSITVPSRACSC